MTTLLQGFACVNVTHDLRHCAFGSSKLAASQNSEHSGNPCLLLNQRPSVCWFFFWGDDYRCGYAVSGFDVQEADALG